MASGPDSSLPVSWQRRGGRFTTPAGAARMDIDLYSYMNSGWVAFDDVELMEVVGGVPVNPNLAPSPGFESAGEWVQPTGTTPSSTRYYYGGTTRIATRVGGGTGTAGLSWLLGDHLGSTSVVVQAGDVSQRLTYLYKPFGELRTGTAETGPLFTGQRFESEVGLYDYKARFYDSSLGRFISADTLIPDPGNPMAWDRYAYSYGNPVKYTDPSGHMVASDTRENGCSGQDIACIIDMYYAESGDTPGLHHSVEAYIRQHPDYDPTQDAGLTASGPFIVTAAQSRVGVENGSFWDYLAFGTMAGFGSFAAGFMPFEVTRGFGYSPKPNRDILGDPDCVGCGYDIWANNPALGKGVRDTIKLIDNGGPFPYNRDGTIFRNDQGLLPLKPQGFYSEYTVPIPGVTGRGIVRLVVGQNGAIYFTPDHYQTFIRIR